MSTPTIRPARRDDLPALVRIYNHYVTNTPVTFDTVEQTEESRLPWFESYRAEGPHRLLVAEAAGGALLGYASSSRFRPKPAYDRTVETTIYLAPDAVGQGVGRRLYGELLDQLVADPSLHLAVGGMTLPNDASAALHEKLGYELVGIYREVGFKFGKYWDVRWVQRTL